MGTITSGIGLISGINTGSIIDQLMTLEARPQTLLKGRIDAANQQKLAFTDIATRLTGLKLSAQLLKKPSSFQASSATSTDEKIITATTGTNAATGSFQFQVARLVTAQQSISGGFSDSTTQKVGAGAITIEQGGGEVYSQTPLSRLNGGAGVQLGSFRITDGSGHSGVIDISQSLTLNDVVKKINNSLDVNVKAAITGDGLTLTDLTGQSLSNFTVTDLGGGQAATDLGIVGAGVGGVLTGADINFVGRSTLLADLNDGRGVRGVGSAPDFQITDTGGATYDISVKDLTTVGSLLDAINQATSGQVLASTTPGQNGITLTDNAGGGGSLSVTALNGSKAAADLGIEQSPGGNQIDGRAVLASLNSVLLSSLRGGQGLTLGNVSITDRTGASDIVDFTGARNVQDVLDLINNDTNIAVTARLKASGNGIEIADRSGGTGDLSISDVDSTTAAELGIAGTFGPSQVLITGANLQRQWVSENTQLSSYNGGKGVTPGKIKLTNSLGQTANIDLSQASNTTLKDVINKINSNSISVVASINANGDGLLLTDAAGGGLTMKVEEVDATTASDLNIKGSAVSLQIDGSFEKTLTISATDTLDTVRTAINNLGFGVGANIINDGSSATPFRLSLTGRNTGRAGRVVFDAGATALQTQNLVEAQDATVFIGASGSSQPLIVTSSTNKIANVIQGVTLDLHSTSSAPVTINVSRNVDNIVSELNKFADNFNQLVDKLKEDSAFDAATNKKGVLLGDATVQQVEEKVYAILQTNVPAAGTYRTLAQVGVTLGPGSKVVVDEDKFRTAVAADAGSVQKLFSFFEKGNGTTIPDKKGIGGIMEDAITKLIDPVNGIITLENKTLDAQTTQFQERIDLLGKLLDSKRLRLQTQFANMESVLAGLQSQQSAINSLSGLTTSTTKTTTK
jgi:flagellar hook-associated protein 2